MKQFIVVCSIILSTLLMPYNVLAYDGVKNTHLSLEEAIILALSSNSSIVSAHLDRVANKFSLKKSINEFELQYSLSGSGTVFSKNFDSSESAFDAKKISLTPTVGIKNSFGTTFSVSMPYGIGSNNKHNTSSSLVVTQSLLRGFGRDVNLNSLRTAYNAERSNKLALRNGVSSAVINIVKRYRALISTNYTLSAKYRSLRDAKENIKNTRAKINSGRLPSSDLVQAQAQYESLNLSVKQQENDVNDAKQDLLTEIGLDPYLKLEVPKNLSISKNPYKDMDDIQAHAIENNAEYINAVLIMDSTKKAKSSRANNRVFCFGFVV